MRLNHKICGYFKNIVSLMYLQTYTMHRWLLLLITVTVPVVLYPSKDTATYLSRSRSRWQGMLLAIPQPASVAYCTF